MNQPTSVVIAGLALFTVGQAMSVRSALAIPAWSRQTGEPCSTCHDVIPKLNHTGQEFRVNGFRLPDLNKRDVGRDETPKPGSTENGLDMKPEPSDRSFENLRGRGAR